MDELRVLRREDGSLVLANELGEEFRLVIDEEVAQEVRLATRRSPSTNRVRPREIQALLRAGKTRAEVAAQTGLDEADVLRFEEPVRAEQRYMLDLAHAVSVRTEPGYPGDTQSANDDEQRFGQVISERLIGLGNTVNIWRSWRDEEAGWLIGLEFDSRDGDHDAVWSFDHKKRVLSPLTPDATNLSKLGDVGDRLIPKLRAVDAESPARSEPEPFDPDALLAPTAEVQPLTPEQAPAGAGDDLLLNPDAEYERRRDIDHLAVNTPDEGETDLSQTADLLDALRRRRGERSLAAEALGGEAPEPGEGGAEHSSGGSEGDDATELLHDLVDPGPRTQPVKRSGAAANIWGTAGVSGANPAAGGAPLESPAPADAAERATDGSAGAEASSQRPEAARGAAARGSRLRAVLGDLGAGGAQPSEEAGGGQSGQDAHTTQAQDTPKRPETKREAKRGRSSIPSWDDILFGTRSDDDPA
ncbi:septation protein SepH [Leucobacter albus]|uniref:Septation protein SepH n=1 Tax=Leucobacter albus TaxID=272210 RepID=A0ABW3TJM9_9MICO